MRRSRQLRAHGSTNGSQQTRSFDLCNDIPVRFLHEFEDHFVSDSKFVEQHFVFDDEPHGHRGPVHAVRV